MTYGNVVKVINVRAQMLQQFFKCKNKIKSKSQINIYEYLKRMYFALACYIIAAVLATCTAAQAASCSNGYTSSNGVTTSESATGSVGKYSGPYTSCSVTTPSNSKYLGQNGKFSYTVKFSSPVNNIGILITLAGHTYNENFIFTTDTGTPAIIKRMSCFETIIGNELLIGKGAPQDGAAGGKFTIQNAQSYTSLTIRGNGGHSGSLLYVEKDSVCIECPTVPKAMSYGAGCAVATCENGYKVSAAKDACVACDVPKAVSYGAGCVVETCESGHTATNDGTACRACDVPHAASFGSECEVESCDGGYKVGEAKDACDRCGAPHVLSFSAGCEVASCEPGFTVINDGKACERCKPGTFSGLAGACEGCGPGTKANDAQTGCEQCAAGTYSAGQANEVCVECGAGSYNTEPGQAACELCPAGTYNPHNGSAALAGCAACPAGTYNPDTGRTAEEDCLPCAPATRSEGRATACEPCADGTVAAFDPLAEGCVVQQCIDGHYAAGAGDGGSGNGSSCVPCGASNAASYVVGDQHCAVAECEGGYFLSGGSCVHIGVPIAPAACCCCCCLALLLLFLCKRGRKREGLKGSDRNKNTSAFNIYGQASQSDSDKDNDLTAKLVGGGDTLPKDSDEDAVVENKTAPKTKPERRRRRSSAKKANSSRASVADGNVPKADDSFEVENSFEASAGIEDEFSDVFGSVASTGEFSL